MVVKMTQFNVIFKFLALINHYLITEGLSMIRVQRLL